jgi:hypothetical protein
MAPGVTVRILYHHEPQGWWAESPDIDRWTMAAPTYDDVRQLAEDGAPFALASAGENRGDEFDEARFANIELEHFVPAPARTA